MSLDELNRLETETLQVEPFELETADLALTELRPYTVGPSDILNITLTGLREQYTQTMLTLRVHDDGTVMLPMVGKVEVAGLDLKGVEKALYDAHVPQYVKDMSVFVQLGGPEETTVVVVGAAGESGLVKLPRNERSVLYALARAAGFSPAGSGRVHVRPVRPERPELTYDLTDINDLRRALLAPPLESGDMVVVEPAEPSAVYVTGLVNTPGPVPLPQNGSLSLVRTVAAAGGLRDFLDPQEATLWRTLADGQQVRVKLALADVMTGKMSDMDLRPGDVLDVPHTAETRFREWFAANIRLGPFGVTAVYDPVADYRARLLRDDDRYGGDTISRALLETLSTGAAEILVPPVPTTTSP
jgi:polysaccharide export outer membrane protein